MRRTSQIVGAISVADGLFMALFSGNYIRRFWGSFNLGPQYRNTINSYASLPDLAIRLIGVAELALGVGLMLPNGITKEKLQKVQVEESVSKERFSQILRELAQSLDESSEFHTVVRGQQVGVPAQADMKDMKVEYEQKEGAGELELEVKWKGAA
jgi:amphi-Trp domain-containing protein